MSEHNYDDYEEADESMSMSISMDGTQSTDFPVTMASSSYDAKEPINEPVAQPSSSSRIGSGKQPSAPPSRKSSAGPKQQSSPLVKRTTTKQSNKQALTPALPSGVGGPGKVKLRAPAPAVASASQEAEVDYNTPSDLAKMNFDFDLHASVSQMGDQMRQMQDENAKLKDALVLLQDHNENLENQLQMALSSNSANPTAELIKDLSKKIKENTIQLGRERASHNQVVEQLKRDHSKEVDHLRSQVAASSATSAADPTSADGQIHQLKTQLAQLNKNYRDKLNEITILTQRSRNLAKLLIREVGGDETPINSSTIAPGPGQASLSAGTTSSLFSASPNQSAPTSQLIDGSSTAGTIMYSGPNLANLKLEQLLTHISDEGWVGKQRLRAQTISRLQAKVKQLEAQNQSLSNQLTSRSGTAEPLSLTMGRIKISEDESPVGSSSSSDSYDNLIQKLTQEKKHEVQQLKTQIDQLLSEKTDTIRRTKALSSRVQILEVETRSLKEKIKLLLSKSSEDDKLIDQLKTFSSQASKSLAEKEKELKMLYGGSSISSSSSSNSLASPVRLPAVGPNKSNNNSSSSSAPGPNLISDFSATEANAKISLYTIENQNLLQQSKNQTKYAEELQQSLVQALQLNQEQDIQIRGMVDRMKALSSTIESLTAGSTTPSPAKSTPSKGKPNSARVSPSSSTIINLLGSLKTKLESAGDASMAEKLQSAVSEKNLIREQMSKFLEQKDQDILLLQQIIDQKNLAYEQSFDQLRAKLEGIIQTRKK